MGLKSGGAVDSLCSCHWMRGRMQGPERALKVAKYRAVVIRSSFWGECQAARVRERRSTTSIGISAWSVGFGSLV
jgi:hypothetical protein